MNQSDMDFACRSCGSRDCALVLDLGSTPLANALVPADALHREDPRYPLTLVYCQQCSLVQIKQSVPPAKMFEDYLYFSSFSDTMIRHARELAHQMIRERGLNQSHRIVEIASNDGYLLQFYRDHGCEVVGVEPARNIAKVAMEQRHIPTRVEFFSSDAAARMAEEGLLADVIHAHNVLAHVPTIKDFLAGIKRILKPSGLAVIEVPYVRDMVDKLEFDTIYHEHLFYFSATALKRLVEEQRLAFRDIERVSIHGGSLRITIAHEDRAQTASSRVAEIFQEEQRVGITSIDYYRDFARRVNALGDELRGMLANARKNGKRIAAYGAAAKGSTLLNYFQIGADTIDFVADRSQHKQGRYMPGVHIPIVSPDEVVRRNPDYLLILPWNLAGEIMGQLGEYKKQGGKFILPLPTVTVV